MSDKKKGGKKFIPFAPDFHTEDGIKNAIVDKLSIFACPQNFADDIEIKSIDWYYMPLYRFFSKVLLTIPQVGQQEIKFDFVIAACDYQPGLEINGVRIDRFMEKMSDKNLFKDAFGNFDDSSPIAKKVRIVQPDLTQDSPVLRNVISTNIEILCSKIIDNPNEYVDLYIEDIHSDDIKYYLPQLSVEYSYKTETYKAYISVISANFGGYISWKGKSPYDTFEFLQARKQAQRIREEEKAKQRAEIAEKVKAERIKRLRKEWEERDKEKLRKNEELAKQRPYIAKKELEDKIKVINDSIANFVRLILGGLGFITFLIVFLIKYFLDNRHFSVDKMIGISLNILGLAIIISEAINLMMIPRGCKKKWKEAKIIADTDFTKSYRNARRKRFMQTIISIILLLTGVAVMIVANNSPVLNP